MELQLLAPTIRQITVYILYKYRLHKPKLISYCNVYGVSEILTLRKRDKKRLTAIEMKFFKRTEEYTHSDHKSNANILGELKEEPVELS
jgi:hypothetical protein